MKPIQKILLILVSLVLFHLMSKAPVKSQSEASQSGNFNDITENVKRRIQDVIEEQISQKAQSVIYGKLNSITTNTLFVTQESGVKLASTSAETAFVRLPGNTKLTFEDLAIDEYVIIVGLENENEVINAAKVVSQKNPPVQTDQKTFYGNIFTYDPKKYLITVENPQNMEKQSFLVGRKSNVYLANPDGTKTKIDRKQDFPVQSQVLIIHEGLVDPESDTLIQEMLVFPSQPIITPAELVP